jgi:DNA-directed RNA polymerase specialized sigma24 family protein
MSLTERRDSFARFPATSWGLIRRASNAEGSDRTKSLEEFVSRYWRPVYGYFRSRGLPSEEAKDCVQDFLWDLVRKDKLLKAPVTTNPQPHRFRNWLRRSARNFSIDNWRRRQRSSDAADRSLSLNQINDFADGVYEPVNGADADQEFVRLWRLQILEESLAQVRQEAALLGRDVDVTIFERRYLASERPAPSWDGLAREFQVESATVARRKAEWAVRRISRSVRRLIRRYAESEDEVGIEINLLAFEIPDTEDNAE